VPPPLPPQLQMTWQLTRRLSEANRALGELVGVARILPRPEVLVRPFVRREAVLSSRIEGTQASLGELLLYEAAGEPTAERSDVREVMNYVLATEYGMERLYDLPLSLRFIRELHERLMLNVRGGTRQPGQFRTVQNWIGAEGSDLAHATYVPPPVPQMHEALDALEKYLHTPPDMPTLIRAALIHYQFEAIHPFLDGNGRIGRLLVFFVLFIEEVLDHPVLYLSAFFERHRAEYYERLLAVTTQGAWEEWIDFFLRGVTEQSRDGVARTRELLAYLSEYRARVSHARNAGAVAELIEVMFSEPIKSVSEVATVLRVTYPAAKKTVLNLVRMGILRPVNVGKRKLYVLHEVVSILGR
jgi:Fic family protein